MNKSLIAEAAILSQATKPFWRCSPNSGVFFVRNNKGAKAIAKGWLESFRYGDKHGLFYILDGDGYLHDQAGLNRYVLPDLINSSIKVVPNSVMNGRESPLIRHYLGLQKNMKANMIYETLASLDLPPGMHIPDWQVEAEEFLVKQKEKELQGV